MSKIVIVIKNIQSIKEAKFVFNTKGVVRFKGGNSNGKSILAKVMSRILLQLLPYDEERLPMIRDGEDSGSFGMAWNGQQLIVHLDVQSNKTFYQLVRQDGTKVTRYVREDGIDQMLNEFGFRIFGKRDLCIQLCTTFGPMPFVNTSFAVNTEMVNSVITDEASEHFLSSYSATYKEGAEKFKLAKKQLATVQTELANINLKNVNGLDVLVKKLEELYRKSAYLIKCEPIDLEPFPSIDFTMEKCEKLEELPIIHYIEPVPKLYSLCDQLIEMDKVKRGKCPTCGKPFIDGGAECHEK